MIDPRNLKPTKSIALGSESGLGELKGTLTHMFRNEEIGKFKKGGKRFTDRLKIGKFPAKLVGIDFYVAKDNTGNVVGMQASYDVKSAIKKSQLNMVVDVKKTTKVHYALIDSADYFKGIECVINNKGLIIGLIFISVKGVNAKGGAFEGNRRSLNIERN